VLLTECLRPKPFESFGRSRWSVVSRRPQEQLTLSLDLKKTRADIRQAVPATPGVYGMIDAEGQLIYVGKSKKLRNRLLSYFHARSQPEKADRIVEHASRIVWQCAPDEFAALLRELELIHKWRPRLNVQGQPGRMRRMFVCIGRGPAPRVYLTADPNGNETARFGPIRGGRFTRRAVQRLNDLAGLRDCPIPTPIVFAEQKRLFEYAETPRCLRFDLGNCLGPCSARCEETDYDHAVGIARDFLAGRNTKLQQTLNERMAEASGRRQFERAATLRDARMELDWLCDHLQRLREVRGRDRFVYALSEQPDRETWYLLAGGQVIEAASAPRDRRTAACRIRMLERVYNADRSFLAKGNANDLDVSILVASWFRHRGQELAQTLLPDHATEICQAVMRAGRTSQTQSSLCRSAVPGGE
jgi:excinuclease ABC subunit C